MTNHSAWIFGIHFLKFIFFCDRQSFKWIQMDSEHHCRQSRAMAMIARVAHVRTRLLAWQTNWLSKQLLWFIMHGASSGLWVRLRLLFQPCFSLFQVLSLDLVSSILLISWSANRRTALTNSHSLSHSSTRPPQFALLRLLGHPVAYQVLFKVYFAVYKAYCEARIIAVCSSEECPEMP